MFWKLGTAYLAPAHILHIRTVSGTEPEVWVRMAAGAELPGGPGSPVLRFVGEQADALLWWLEAGLDAYERSASRIVTVTDLLGAYRAALAGADAGDPLERFAGVDAPHDYRPWEG